MNTGLVLHRLILGNCGSGGTTAINLSVGSPAVAVNHSVLEQDPKPQIAEADERVDVWRGGTKEPEESYRKSNNKLIFSKRAKPVCVGGVGGVLPSAVHHSDNRDLGERCLRGYRG